MPITTSAVFHSAWPDREVDEHRVRGRDRAVAHAARGDRRLQQLGQLGRSPRPRPGRRRRRRSTDARRAATRRRRGRSRSGRSSASLGTGGWSDAGRRRAPPVDRDSRCSTGRGRPETSASSAACSCLVADVAVVEQLGVLGQLAEDRVLVDELVQHAEAASARGGRDLADDRQHAGVRPVAARQRRAGVEHARARARRRTPAGLPATSEAPFAMYAAPCSWRLTIGRMSGASTRASKKSSFCTPGQAEQGVDAGQPDRGDDLLGDRAGVVALTGHRGLSLRLLERRGHGARARARLGSCHRRPER